MFCSYESLIDSLIKKGSQVARGNPYTCVLCSTHSCVAAWISLCWGGCEGERGPNSNRLDIYNLTTKQ